MSLLSGVTTTTEDVLNELVAQIESIDGLANQVFIAAVPTFLGSAWMGDLYVEVCPGAGPSS